MIKRTKLKDIAEALNISITTVSRAINNKEDISKETREAVLSMAEKLNYRPNALAVSLRKSEYNVIGVILPTVDHYFFSTMLKGIMHRANQANYLVMIGESMNNPQKEMEILDQFLGHCVTGILISPCVHSTVGKNLSILRAKRTPLVMVDRYLENESYPCVKYDDEKGAFLAVEHLILQNYKNICYIGGSKDCAISTARFEGYKNALLQYNLPFNPKNVMLDLDASSQTGYKLSKQLYLADQTVDAFFTVNDDLASGVYQTAKEFGLSIPNDIGVVGYSDSQLAIHLSPPLSSVEQPGASMGEYAFDFLQQQIIGNNTILHKTFDARLNIRNSSMKNLHAISA